MPNYRMIEVDADQEIDMVTHLIMSDHLCKLIIDKIKPIHFKIGYAYTIFGWVKDFYKKFEKAPGIHFKDIFYTKSKFLDADEKDLILQFIKLLEINLKIDQKLNIEYLRKKYIIHINKVEMLDVMSRAEVLMQEDEVDEAIDMMKNFKKTAFESFHNDKVTVNNIKDIFLFDDEDILFKFNGPLGDLIGDLRRGWFVCFMGPMKRGKTFYLIESAIQALSNRLNVLFVSLEMKKSEVEKRIIKRLCSAKRNFSGFGKFPVFDCLNNQRGTCNFEWRKNREIIIDDNGVTRDFSPGMAYSPCTACIGLKGYKSYFQPATWFQMVERPELTSKLATDTLKKFYGTFGNDKFRIKAFPRFSASPSDVFSYIKDLEETEKWRPDVLIWDYPGISKADGRQFDERSSMDSIYKTIGGYSMAMNILTIGAHQSNRGSISLSSIKQESTSEDIRIIAHVDAMATINQTKEEKRKMLARIGVIAHRHKDFDEDRQALVLQQLDYGQTMIGSHVIWHFDE